MRLPASEPENEWLNLTPLLDVVLNLLIFFLIATHFAQQENDMNVLLPEEVGLEPVTSNQKLVVNVTQDGRFRVNERDYTEEQLAALIRGHATTNPHQGVVIRGDRRSELRHSTRVMALCNRAKVTYKLATFEQN